MLIPMPLANLATFLRKHPEAVITKVDHTAESIFFTEQGRQWVMIFDGETVVGVWDMTPADWSEAAQDQAEAMAAGANGR